MIHPKLDVPFRDSWEGDRETREMATETRSVNDKGTSHAKLMVVVVRNATGKARKGLTFRNRQVSFLKADNVGLFRKIFQCPVAKLFTITPRTASGIIRKTMRVVGNDTGNTGNRGREGHFGCWTG